MVWQINQEAIAIEKIVTVLKSIRGMSCQYGEASGSIGRQKTGRKAWAFTVVSMGRNGQGKQAWNWLVRIVSAVCRVKGLS